METPDVAAARSELSELLKQRACVTPSADMPLQTVAGRSARWIFYSWQVTLSGRGLALAATCLLDRLRRFEGTQLVTAGYAGIPLVSACVALAGDRYSGLVIRDKRKGYGALRRVEGPVDRSKPVIVIDDTLGTGRTMLQAIEVLKEEGLQVEGGLALVLLPGVGGVEQLEALGLRAEYVFDSHKDLGLVPPEPPPFYQRYMPSSWGPPAIDDGLHPAVAARRAAEAYIATGEVPTPPNRFDQGYDCRGGTFVSMRERDSDNRISRCGFWHFNPADADLCRDLVLATVGTVADSAIEITKELLQELKIAVTFLGPMEKIPPAKLDFKTYGIVARSKADPNRLGGALPNTQYFIGETEQYRQARFVNARMSPLEPHDLLRHRLTKCVEPGEHWLRFGFPEEQDWTCDADLGKRLTTRAREHLAALRTGAAPSGEPLPIDLVPAPVFAIGVTLYYQGIRGCSLSYENELDTCLRKAVAGAWEQTCSDVPEDSQGSNELTLSVSVLHDREWIGLEQPEHAAIKMRPGRDSLSVAKGERHAIFLPSVPVIFNWSKQETARRLLYKAGIADPDDTYWAIFPTVTWYDDGNQLHHLDFGFPDRSSDSYEPDRWAADIEQVAAYIHNHLQETGLPEYLYLPVTGERHTTGHAGRLVHALTTLRDAAELLGNDAWRTAAERGLAHCLANVRVPEGEPAFLDLPDQEPGAIADCLLLASMSGATLDDERSAALASRVQQLLQPDGRITESPTGIGVESDHDHLPGIALLAIARLVAASGDRSALAAARPCLAWYRRRFRSLRPWGMVGWHAQAWAAMHELTGDPEQAELVLEIADWALDWQHELSGSFLTDIDSEGMSFFTAAVCEGMAAAWRLAQRLNDQQRCERYAQSCRAALRFMNRLIIRAEDQLCMPDPHAALGGVREAVHKTQIRIDFASHTLAALIGAEQCRRSHAS